MKRRCRNCDLFRETRTVMKWGNATEHRKGHWRKAQICRLCAIGIYAFQLPSPWSVRGLRKAWKL